MDTDLSTNTRETNFLFLVITIETTMDVIYILFCIACM